MRYSLTSYKDLVEITAMSLKKPEENLESIPHFFDHEQFFDAMSLRGYPLLSGLLKEYPPFAAYTHRLTARSVQHASHQRPMTLDIHDLKYASQKTIGQNFFRSKYGPLLNDRSEKIQEVIEILQILKNKVCLKRQYDSLLLSEERHRKTLKARIQANERGEAFNEAMIEPFDSIETLVQQFENYMTYCQTNVATQSIIFEELIYLRKWALEAEKKPPRWFFFRSKSQKEEKKQRWGVLIESLDESRTAYFINQSGDHSCALGVAERLQLKMYYIAAAEFQPSVNPEESLIEQLITPLIQKDPERPSVYLPTDFLYQTYLKASGIVAELREEVSFERRTDAQAQKDYDILFEKYCQRFKTAENERYNKALVEKMMKAKFDAVIASAPYQEQPDLEQQEICDKLYDKKMRGIMKLVQKSQPRAEKEVIHHIAKQLGFTTGFAELLLSLLGQDFLLLPEQDFNAPESGLKLLEHYVNEERIMISEDPILGKTPKWDRQQAAMTYTMYLKKIHEEHQSADRLFIDFLPLCLSDPISQSFISKEVIALDRLVNDQESNFCELRDDIYTEYLQENLIELNGKTRHELLFFFITRNNLEAVKVLIQYGARPGYVNSGNKTPIAHAVALNHVDIISYLCTLENLNINWFDNSEMNPFTYAMRNNNVAVFNMLLKHPAADLKKCDAYGNSLYMFALKNNKTWCYPYLASPNIVNYAACNKKGETALTFLLPKAPLPTLQEHLPYYPQDAQAGYTILMQALLCQRYDFAHYLIEQRKNIDFSLKDQNGETLLINALRSSQKNPSFIEKLLEQKQLNINAQDKHGQTALMWALSGDDTAIADLLVRKCAAQLDVRLRNHEGLSAADMARQKGYLTMAQRLDNLMQESQILDQKQNVLLFPREPYKKNTPHIQSAAIKI